MNVEGISLGLDIATAISVIGAAIAYITNLNKSNEKMIGEEREYERVQKLSESETKYNKLLSDFVQFGNNGELEKALNAMGDIYHYCHYDLRRHFTVYASKSDLDFLESTIVSLKEAHTEFNKHKKFDAVSLTNKLVELDMNILLQLRRLMNVETSEFSEKVVKKYAIDRFGYIENK